MKLQQTEARDMEAVDNNVGIGSAELIIVAGVVFFIFYIIFWLRELINILKNEFTGNNKIIWLLVVLFIPLIGLIAYFFIGRKQKLQNGKIEVAEISTLATKEGGSLAIKLRDLEALKKEGLISDDEYQEKRAEIMQKKW
jgi:hypothetical protein